MAVQDPTYHRFGESDDVINIHDSKDTVYIYSGAGHDELVGGSADDALNGAVGNDELQGGAGNDRLNGGEGSDRLFGGSGDDTFAFTKGEVSNNHATADQFDHIIDFTGAGQHGGDMIRFEGFSENSTLSFDHVAANYHNAAVYTVADGDYSAQFVIQFSDDFDPSTQQLVKGDYAFYA